MSHETEKLLVCPYNKAHSILQYRMQTHLHKCRKQHPNSEMATCSHNGTHIMPKSELELHENYLCLNRHSFQASVYNVEEVKSIAPIVHIDIPDGGENWDDGQVNLFDPKKNAEEKSLFRGLHCAPPSERKAFRIEHRLKIQERLEGSKPTPQRKERQESNALEPLRPPQALPKGFVGRGVRLGTDEVAQSPEMAAQMANLSLDGSSKSSSGAAAAPSVQSAPRQWVGLGRGRPVNLTSGAPPPAEPSPAPAAGAWGRGRPKF